MFDWIRIDPVPLVVLAAFAVVAVAFGIRRHEPWRAIAMSTVGWIGYIGAMFWATELNRAAWWPVAIAGLGMYMVATAHERWQRNRSHA